MTTELVKQDGELDIKAQLTFGKKALHELKLLVTMRPEKEKLVVNGRQYLFFADWQILGSFFGITAYVRETKEITQDIPTGNAVFPVERKVIGFWARAEAWQHGKVISAAEAECMWDEPNWKSKPRFQVRSMAETRACAKVLRNVLQWVVRLPDDRGKQMELADEAAEEIR